MTGAAGFSPVQLTPTRSLSKRTPLHLGKAAQSYFKQAPAFSRKAQMTVTSPEVGGKAAEMSEHNSKGSITQPANKHSVRPTLAINLPE